MFLARLKLARGDAAGAAAILAQADRSARQHNFVHRIPEVASAQVLTLLHHGNLAAAAHLAQTHELPFNEFECAKIVGRKFEGIGDLAGYLRDGGCSEIIEVLAAVGGGWFFRSALKNRLLMEARNDQLCCRFITEKSWLESR